MDTITAIKKALGGVTQDEAIGFINTAMRNWSHVPKLDADDLLDLAEELQRFSERRYASTLESLQRENVELRAWQAGALSCREAEQARIDDYKRELEEALCAQDIATREHTAAFGIAQTRAEVAEAEVMRLRALSVVGEPPFEFDRYISGALMAEGVRIEKIETLEKAMVVAAKVASRGPNGEVPVLIMRARTALSSTGDTHGN